MIKFKSGSAFSLLRRAVAFIVQQNDDVVGKWHGIDVLKDLCNMVAGYNENSADMRGVDVPMIKDAFDTKPPGGTCVSFEDMTGDDIGYYFLHLKLEQNGKAVQIACSQSRDASLIINVGGTPIDKFGINDTTELWLHSKHRLAQLLRQRKKEAKQWFALLGGTSFSHQFVLSQIEEAPDNKKREYSIKASRRATVEETAIIQHYTASSDNKMKKFSRALFCTFGWRPFAPIHEQKEFKNSFLEDQYKTKQFLIITLQRNIKSSKQGSTELRRDVDVMVTHVSIAENALCFAQGLMESKTLLPSQGLFGVPFMINGEFEDVILYKLSIDAGNKSTKLLLSIINRKKPQSQDNVKFCVEMAGVKDDPHNLANAVFTNKYGNNRLRIPEDFEHEDMEMAEELRSMDTKLYVCTKCTPRHVYVGKNALKIHIQECHDGNIQAEHDAIDGRIS